MNALVTITLVTLAVIILVYCFCKFLLGTRLRVDQLDRFTEIMIDYWKDNKFVASKAGKPGREFIIFDKGFIKASNLHSILISTASKGAILITWSNGRKGYFVPRSEEEAKAGERFLKTLLHYCKRDLPPTTKELHDKAAEKLKHIFESAGLTVKIEEDGAINITNLLPKEEGQKFEIDQEGPKDSEAPGSDSKE